MYTVLKDSVHTARKEYRCDGSEFLLNSGIINNPKGFGVSFHDMRKLVIIRREKYKILPGTKYLYQAGVYEGDFYTAKIRFDVQDICMKYELYND